jgi:magnesium chelatase subunit I
VTLLDDEIPILAGSEINDNPFAPISKYGRQLLEEHGDRTPVAWVTRDYRYVEKLATPDVTIADIIGDVDPIKAARGGHLLSDELTIHYGLLPRSNRGIFALNELPDLAGKIQVGLFNIMQEGDVQIKGYPIRLALDVLLVFSANPEDYTARGKIITPLKDRIGSEILTHYPRAVADGMTITAQEAWLERAGLPVDVPDFVAEVVERIAFEARADKRIDNRSGVSQRLPISVIEHVVSSAERRAIVNREKLAVPRISDLYAALPSITGKIELEYEGELQGGATVARDLVRRACLATFEARAGGADCDAIVAWFDEGGALKVGGDERADALVRGFAAVPGLLDLVQQTGLAGKNEPPRLVAASELVLEGLVAQKRISRADDVGYARARPERRGPGAGGGISWCDARRR